MYNKPQYEEDKEEFKGAWATHNYDGIAWRALGWEIEEVESESYFIAGVGDDEDDPTNWSHDWEDRRTGRVVMMMVGDDRLFVYDRSDIRPLKRADYCGECGQIGCQCDGYDRSEDE